VTFVPRSAPLPTGPAVSSWLPEPARIRARRDEAPDVFTLELELPERPTGLAFAPGQFNMLYAFGVGEAAISLSGDPACPATVLHTVRDVGVVTSALGRLREGDVLGLRGPYGSPWPVDAIRGADVLFVAGGLGLAPLRPAVLHVLRHRDAYGRVALVYGARSPRELLFLRDLEAWRARDDLELLVTVDHADPGWTGHVGVAPALVDRAGVDPDRTEALVCGPEVMMRFTARALERRGVPDARIHVSLERNMKCAVGLCGRCQLGPTFVCKDGPVLRYDRVRSLVSVREL
jgi:NAD(P)H-flavin reductase